MLKDLPWQLLREVIVVDNNSNDNTANIANDNGATVLAQPIKGYGSACLKGLEYLEKKDIKPDIVVFLDADYSDYPEELPLLIQPILNKQAELVIGSRALGTREKGAMQPHQVFGNWLATTLIKWLFGARFTDLGPFRAVTYEALKSIKMQDTNYGWTVEMQVKVAKLKIPFTEVAVNYRQRVGHSKVSGTIKGSVMAGYKIIATIFKYAI